MAAFVTIWLTALAAATASPVIIAEPTTSPADQPMRLGIEGLRPTQPAELKLSMVDSDGTVWSSRERFIADWKGTIDTAEEGGFSGSYRGLDPMGLFWSMRPERASKQTTPMPFVHTSDGLLYRAVKFKVEAFVDGQRIAEREVERQLVSPDVVAHKVDAPGLVANIYYPARFGTDRRRHPAVITLGGAEGGIESANQYAAWLASHGFIGVAVAYYHMPGLPKDLVNVPIDVVGRAVDWLSAQSLVDRERIGVMGGSWGGIVALATASRDPRLHAVVSWVGSPFAFSGIRRDVPPADYVPSNQASLSYKGQALPFAPLQTAEAYFHSGDPRPLASALLALNRINGPVMMIAGGDDQLGMSGRVLPLAQELLARRVDHSRDQVLFYSDAGHLLSYDYQPTTQRADTGPYVPVGGTPEGYERACVDSGPKVILFLRRALNVRATD